MFKKILPCAILLAFNAHALPQDVASNFSQLNGHMTWDNHQEIKLEGNTYHPQGMVKIGDYFYISSVEVIEQPTKYSKPMQGLDRTAGKGKGHLFKFDKTGKLVAHVTFGEGDIYHPGGLDFDGKNIWMPVAEYRPHSHSNIYKVDPNSLEITKQFTVNDHIGALSYDPEKETLYGGTWGSREFYTWPLKDNKTNPKSTTVKNTSYYIDYQDCKFTSEHFLVCSGLKKYTVNGKEEVAFGGLELIDTRSMTLSQQMPVDAWIKPDLPMTQNPFWIEKEHESLTFYFAPEDNKTSIYVYKEHNS
ncbi:DUF6454 family protein [Photobacterium angustum]|uniref:DUF6454 family protein n=1 Tax=Photobacterium angustum TaxID=661 RepID=UPI0005EBAA1C|nr:DUF6454 family protein [Photobacterium angustum]PSV68418.1 hypothetical protein CTM95_03570 [Photobacterium angustum]PSW95180.1 hypothetical protein C0W79_09895 [Photobacterium angustum]PSX03994.1 hypothetical protein C0W87_01600 [Photobacterium angustum]PSX37317.1 hypothetical protein C0W38_06310 [Photobacterium angustum]